MKLSNKINIQFFVLLLVVFSMTGIVLYYALGFVVDSNIEEVLENKAEKVKQTLALNAPSEIFNTSYDQTIKIETLISGQVYKLYSDTSIYDADEKENLDCRKLTFTTNIKGQFYKVEITVSRMETEDMVELIFYFMVSLFALIVIMLFLFNSWISSSVWMPFFKTLDQLKQFKVGSKRDIVFTKSNTFEFNQLNVVLNEMTNKIQNDYKKLKEFTENASHEIQTPLAIIKSKLETVLQDQSLPENQQNHIQIAYKSVSRLSKLNEALLLLSKIENQQFSHNSEVNLCQLIKERVEIIEDLLSLKNIDIKLDIETPFIVHSDLFLAETLVSNIIGNAIKHNFENGKIIISSSTNQIVFSNTGNPLNFESDKIFQRFVKNNTSNESSGLGLSIASEICKNYNLILQYNYQDGLHNFKIAFKS